MAVTFKLTNVDNTNNNSLDGKLLFGFSNGAINVEHVTLRGSV